MLLQSFMMESQEMGVLSRRCSSPHDCNRYLEHWKQSAKSPASYS